MRWGLLLVGLTGCLRDPFSGAWDIVEAERGGVVQADVGVIEFGVFHVLAYDFVDGDFVPIEFPRSRVQGASPYTFDDDEQDRETLRNYSVNGFGVFDVEYYRGASTAVITGNVKWPGNRDVELVDSDESAPMLETTLHLKR